MGIEGTIGIIVLALAFAIGLLLGLWIQRDLIWSFADRSEDPLPRPVEMGGERLYVLTEDEFKTGYVGLHPRAAQQPKADDSW